MGVYLYTARKTRPITLRVGGENVKAARLSYLFKFWYSHDREFHVQQMQMDRAIRVWDQWVDKPSYLVEVDAKGAPCGGESVYRVDSDAVPPFKGAWVDCDKVDGTTFVGYLTRFGTSSGSSRRPFWGVRRNYPTFVEDGARRVKVGGEWVTVPEGWYVSGMDGPEEYSNPLGTESEARAVVEMLELRSAIGELSLT